MYINKFVKYINVEIQCSCFHLCRVTATTVKSLKTGATYQFRVRGENAAGLGDPSKPTAPTVVEEQPCLTEYV